MNSKVENMPNFDPLLECGTGWTGSQLWPYSWETRNHTSRPAGVALNSTSLSDPTGCQVQARLTNCRLVLLCGFREEVRFLLAAATAAAAASLCWFLENEFTGPVSDSEQRARLLQGDVLHEVFLRVFLQTELFQVDWSGGGRLHFICNCEAEAAAWLSCQLSASSQLLSFTFSAGDKTFFSVLPKAVVNPWGKISFKSSQCLVSTGF